MSPTKGMVRAKGRFADAWYQVVGALAAEQT